MKAFNSSLRAAQRIMGEEFTHKGIIYEAIAIDELQSGVQVISGGTLADVSTVVLITRFVLNHGGIAENDLILARGVELRIITITGDGSDGITLNCGPAGVTMPNF